MAGLNVGGGRRTARSSTWPASGSTWSRRDPTAASSSISPGSGPTPTMTRRRPALPAISARLADAIPLMVDGVRYLLKNPPEAKIHNVYYWYYATQVLHNYSGREWDTWNRALRKLLIATQTTERDLCQRKLGTRRARQGPDGDSDGRPAHDHGPVVPDAGNLLPLSAPVQNRSGRESEVT